MVRLTPPRLFTDGVAAVDVFFVLSFVLTLPLVIQGEIVALWVGILPLHADPTSSNWFNGILPRRFSLSDHLLMIGKDMSLDPPLWTLSHEMHMALILPCIWIAFTRWGQAQTLAVSLSVSVLVSIWLVNSISGSWATTEK
jgi:peptidoglycan/LPS O-acetylase OafA/YrhL